MSGADDRLERVIRYHTRQVLIALDRRAQGGDDIDLTGRQTAALAGDDLLNAVAGADMENLITDIYLDGVLIARIVPVEKGD